MDSDLYDPTLEAATSALALAFHGARIDFDCFRKASSHSKWTTPGESVDIRSQVSVTTQPVGTRGAIRSAREWQQAGRPKAWAQPTPDQDRVSRSVLDERGRG